MASRQKTLKSQNGAFTETLCELYIKHLPFSQLLTLDPTLPMPAFVEIM